MVPWAKMMSELIVMIFTSYYSKSVDYEINIKHKNPTYWVFIFDSSAYHLEDKNVSELLLAFRKA